VRNFVPEAAEFLRNEQQPKSLASLYRLATDTRMKRVWAELRRHAASDDALVKFLMSAVVPSFTMVVRTRGDHAALARPFVEAAKWCRDSQERDRAAREDPALAAALGRVAKYFDEKAQRIGGNPNSPLVVKRHSRDDVTRAHVRMLGYIVRELFNSPLYSTVATTVSVALDQKVEIDRLRVRDWTKP
jgi:hypothetical protein